MRRESLISRLPVAIVALIAPILMTTGCGHPTLNVQMAPALQTSVDPPADPPASSPADPPASAPASGAGVVAVPPPAGSAGPIWANGTTEVPGVPFYAMRGACEKETVWLEPQYTLTVEVTVDDKAPVVHTMTFSRHDYRQADVQQLIAYVKGLQGNYQTTDPQSCPANIGYLWDPVEAKIAQDPNYQIMDNIDGSGQVAGQEKAGNLIRSANTADVKAVVDYSHQYYLNGRTPWIGNSQVDAKLAANGTLSEGSAQAEDDTWSTILSTVSSLVGSFTGAGSAATAAAPAAAVAPNNAAEPLIAPLLPPAACQGTPNWPAPQHKVAYKVTLSTTMYNHDHKQRDFDVVNACIPEPAGVLAGSYTVKPVDTSAKKQAPGTIEVSGEVQLPPADGKK
jgi:hypothetical protein